MPELRPLPYTSRARVALAIARALAAGRGERDLTPAHVLLGMVREGENAALAVLHHLGVPLPALRAAVERELGPPPGGTQPDEVALPLTPGERDLLAGARAAAEAEGDDHIGPEHLLLAVLAQGGGRAARLLAAHGVNTAAVVAAGRVVINKHRPPVRRRRGPPRAPPNVALQATRSRG